MTEDYFICKSWELSSNWLKQKKREREYIDSFTGKFREILGNSGMAWPQRLNLCHQECVAAIFCVASFPHSQTSSFYKVQRWPPTASDLCLTSPVESMYFSHSSIILAKVSRVSCKHPRANHNPIQEAITVTSISQACSSCLPPGREEKVEPAPAEPPGLESGVGSWNGVFPK